MDYVSLAGALFAEQLKLFRAKGHQQLYNLSYGETYLLFLLAQAGGTLQPGLLSEAMNVTTACVASTLRSMERKNLVSREISRRDRRYVDVALTPEGQERIACTCEKAREDLARVLMRLGEKDAAEYVALVSRLVDILNEEEDA